MLYRLKKFVPEPVVSFYHYALAKVSCAWYHDPSSRMIVIGITGTKGKSSTTKMLAQLLTHCGKAVGYTGTAGFGIRGEEIENRLKMTMPGRFFLQRMLQRMVDAGCQYAIIETTSQGLLQYRHLGINYDMAVFTNLSPEHIEAHGGYENYRAAKGMLFGHLMAKPHKVFGGQRVEKINMVNADDAEAGFYAAYPADRHLAFRWSDIEDVERGPEGLRMQMNGLAFHVPLVAAFEQQNALCAISIAHALGIPLKDIAKAAEQLSSIPGRFERIDCGQPFHVIVDYAHEPKSIGALLESVHRLHPNHIIGIHGSTGGGRDVSRRPLVGELAAKEEDYVFVTNEDPYDDNPLQIIEDVAAGARKGGKVDGKDLFIVLDRQEAIHQALAKAQPGDVVVVTGKGSETVMAVADGKKIPWDDRAAVRKGLEALGYTV